MAAERHANVLLEAALGYAARGWAIFPLQPNTKVPFAGTRGFHDATTDREQITAWWRRWPRANVGLATGQMSGLIGLDEDTYKGADAGVWHLPVTLQVRTARGGLHWLYVYDQPLASVPEGKLAPGICLKADGGYLVAPPSLYNGQPYAWVDAAQPIIALPRRILELVEQVRVPRALRPLAPQAGMGTSSAEYWIGKAVTRAQREGRNVAGLWLAQQLLWNECADVGGAMLLYQRQVEHWEEPPYTEREALASLRQAGQHPRREPARGMGPAPIRPERSQPPTDGTSALKARHDEPPPTDDSPDEALHYTDMGNARRFVARYGELVRHVAAWKQWLIWDGRRWRRDDTDEAMRLAKDTVRAMWHEVAEMDDPDERKDFVKWIYRSESDRGLRAMLAQAASEPEVACSASIFDADPWLLNVRNGTLDLRHGDLLPHRREDLLTKLAPVAYDARARLPLWNEFLETVTEGNAQLMAFLRRAIGYTLTGDTTEEKLFFAHGPSRTGKSTFLEAVKATLGEYAMTADFDTFIARPSSGGPRDDVADMAGARLVASIEVDDGKKLAEGLIKMLTGGDTVKARHLYQRGFEFKPAFKLWLAANHAPRVDASDDAMWNRILRIGFNHVMGKGESKASVKLTLRDPAKAGAAILAWAVQGCIEWQREGLGVPQAVEEATDAYRESMDPLKDFLADCCQLGPEEWTSSSHLRETYEKWCKANGERFPLNGKKFAEALRRHACSDHVKRMGDRTVRGWSGISVSTEI